MSAMITSLADIAIYTETDEIKLQEVFEKMHSNLGDKDAPEGKSDQKGQPFNKPSFTRSKRLRLLISVYVKFSLLNSY